MAFKEVQSLDADTTVSLGGLNKKTGKKNPSQVEGYYLGSKKVESARSKNGFAYLHILQTPKGNLGVWGKTDMDRKVTTATPGTMIRITHTGMQKTPNGEMYKFKVEVDPDNTIEVSESLNVNTDNNDNEEDAYKTENSFGGASEDDEEEEQESNAFPMSAASGDAEARRAKVQALLKRNK